MVVNQQEGTEGKKRKPRVRSQYPFPAYDFAAALNIAEKVINAGGGSLSEETLAITLRLSAKSSGFRLKSLTARQFGLLSKQGENLLVTPLTTAIFKSFSNEEKADAKRTAFLRIPLFQAVATRFKGQPLPESQVLRNVLEREFKVESNRVNDAERVLMDSAREAGLLEQAGNHVYLRFEAGPLQQAGIGQQIGPVEWGREAMPLSPGTQASLVHQGAISPQPSPTVGGILSITEGELAELDDDDFEVLWGVLGKIIRSRGNKGKTRESRAEEIEVMDDEEARLESMGDGDD